MRQHGEEIEQQILNNRRLDSWPGFTQTRIFRWLLCRCCAELGHDVRTTSESGIAGQATPDERVLATAIGEDRIVITHNRRHFIRLHSRNPEHTGIIVCTADAKVSALASRIDAELTSLTGTANWGAAATAR